MLSLHTLAHTGEKATPKQSTKVRRPEIAAEGTSEGWTYFLSRWKTYVKALKIAEGDRAIQLLECCEELLRKSLICNQVEDKALEDMTEAQVLAAMKQLAVKADNPKISRLVLDRMTQDQDEPIRAFAARLRGQSKICLYDNPCSGCGLVQREAEKRVADRLCVGLADMEIQTDLLKDPNQNMTVEATILFIETVGNSTSCPVVYKLS